VSFLSTLALGVALLVVAPYLAHRLRRRRAAEQPFPPARLVPPAPPKARRRARLEDRALFSVRSLAIVTLALLGATPLVRCSRLSLPRAGGASIAMAIVIDDSMSMRADAGGRSRFVRAIDGARELLGSAREGDAVAVVLAGMPARVALAATTDIAAARGVVDSLNASDRATDLDGALGLAQSLIAGLPQVDRRLVLLSDLADGHSDGPPLGQGGSAPLWVALPELRSDAADCAVRRADQEGALVRVDVECGPGHAASGRDVLIEDAQGRVLGRAAVAGLRVDLAVPLAPGSARPDRARLTGADAVAADDVAPVLPAASRSGLLVVGDSESEAVATGGPPIVEQALAALKLDVDVTPVPAVPDRAEDLGGVLGVVLDDPPGLTPEQRHALAAFLQHGGLALIALGPHAAAAPLGANLEPVLSGAVTWAGVASGLGAAPQLAVGAFAESGESLTDLGARRRAVLAPDDVRALQPFVSWSDGLPLFARRAIGRGEVWVVGLPFSVDESELPLRPAFLTLLDQWVRAARERAAPLRTDVGVVWRFAGARRVTVEGPGGPVATTPGVDEIRTSPPQIGVYHVMVDDQKETRVAAPVATELDFRPRAAPGGGANAAVGERRAAVDASGPVAIVLLALMALELALRTRGRRFGSRG
jgi:hypothetical protein